MARFDMERSQREPSSVFLEAGAALARPNAATGERGRDIPDSVALRRDAFAPARAAALRFRRATPVGEAAWQDAAAAGAVDLPSHWRREGALDLGRVQALGETQTAGPMDGLLGEVATGLATPGLDAAWPISPSGLERLLGCPHRFLLDTMLGFAAPAGAPGKREINPLSWGSLFHAAAEAVYREHGPALCGGEGSREECDERADRIVDRVFGEFLEQYPLVGERVRASNRDRLRSDVRELIAGDWNARQFVAVERSFGQPDPVRLILGPRTLFLRGRIDRLDVEGRRTLVRDLKTGRAYPRIGKEGAPNHRRDVQIATYGLVAQVMAGPWGITERIGAAYAYFGRRGVEERDFRQDFDTTLAPAAREWLGLAAGLLAERAFPRTPDIADCEHCPFRPVCGPGAPARAAQVLADGPGTLGQLRALKGPPTRPDDEEDPE
jgi:RecB family exonuclease